MNSIALHKPLTEVDNGNWEQEMFLTGYIEILTPTDKKAEEGDLQKRKQLHAYIDQTTWIKVKDRIQVGRLLKLQNCGAQFEARHNGFGLALFNNALGAIRDEVHLWFENRGKIAYLFKSMTGVQK